MMTDTQAPQPIKVTAQLCPDSVAHVPEVGLANIIPNPGLPRATITATREHPNGVPRPAGAPDNQEKTVLQQHVDFFDINNDGFITMGETWTSFRRLGFNLFWSAIAVLFIHTSMSLATHDKSSSWGDVLSMSLNIKNINRAKHGSDSGIYDKEGRFIPQAFEDLFSTLDKDDKGGLSFNEGVSLIRHNREAWDVFGWLAAIFEWGFLYMLAGDSKGIVSKENIRAQFDGSLFYKIAQQNEDLAHQRATERAAKQRTKTTTGSTASNIKQAAKQTVEHGKQAIAGGAKKEL